MATKTETVMTKLADIQQKLKAPKNQVNEFGGYKYRSCEDILEAVKPLLGAATLVISDEVLEVGGRVYVKATATLSLNGDSVSATAYAREPESKKKMDESQITGAASSYARKYALNGLFCIDDTKDADATNTHGKDEQKDRSPAPRPNPLSARRRMVGDKLVELLGSVQNVQTWLAENDLSPVNSANFAQLAEIEGAMRSLEEKEAA